MKLVVNRYKVKEAMAKKKIGSLKELALTLGISTNQISNVLSDKYNPIKSNIVELAEFLEVSPLELISEEEIHKNAKV